jgi:hypothetical protein
VAADFVYFNFIATTWPRWITIVATIVGAAGLYGLWEEHVNLGQQSRDSCYAPKLGPSPTSAWLVRCDPQLAGATYGEVLLAFAGLASSHSAVLK